MLEGLVIGILSGLLVLGIGGAIKWLRSEDNRETVRQKLCRHEWEPTPDFLITPDRELCVKCNARR